MSDDEWNDDPDFVVRYTRHLFIVYSCLARTTSVVAAVHTFRFLASAHDCTAEIFYRTFPINVSFESFAVLLSDTGFVVYVQPAMIVVAISGSSIPQALPHTVA